MPSHNPVSALGAGNGGTQLGPPQNASNLHRHPGKEMEQP